ncbi:MAG: hypothetical protein KDA89_13035, partial [Planctomycetaceae bacterium]|nr:hypothetical protein [Planctomycetaceae bacterium]
IAVFLGLAVPAAVYPAASRHATALDLLAAELAGDAGMMQQIEGIAVGALLLFLMGLADDRWNLSWKLRLGVQFLVAAGATAAGVRATVFVAQPWIGITITILWIMVLTNAMNFLDNMDGLSAGIGVIASLMSAAILVLMVREPHLSVAFVLVLLAGSLRGFLC